MKSFETRLVDSLFSRLYGVTLSLYARYMTLAFGSALGLSLLVLNVYAFESVAADAAVALKVIFSIGLVLIWVQLGVIQVARYRRRLRELPLSVKEVRAIQAEALNPLFKKELEGLARRKAGLSLADVARAHRQAEGQDLPWPMTYCPD